MKYIITDDRLKMVVDELGEEYKDLLIQRVLEGKGDNDIEQVDAVDLIREDVEIKEPLRIDKKLGKSREL